MATFHVKFRQPDRIFETLIFGGNNTKKEREVIRNYIFEHYPGCKVVSIREQKPKKASKKNAGTNKEGGR
jgi:hypothetical protein